MIFIDTNVFMYAVGRPHPLRDEARGLLLSAKDRSEALATSTEVFQELLHAYLPVDRTSDLERAWRLARAVTVEIWPVELDDVELARALTVRHPELAARDLVHLASCRRRGVGQVRTFDRGLRAAITSG